MSLKKIITKIDNVFEYIYNKLRISIKNSIKRIKGD